jgi:hypothetical protein
MLGTSIGSIFFLVNNQGLIGTAIVNGKDFLGLLLVTDLSFSINLVFL